MNFILVEIWRTHSIKLSFILTPSSHFQCRLAEKWSVFSSTDKKRKLSVAARPELLNFKTEAVQVDVYTYSCTHGCTRVYFATVCTTVLVLIRKKNARAGARPFYLPHAKQTLYHLSYDWHLGYMRVKSGYIYRILSSFWRSFLHCSGTLAY